MAFPARTPLKGENKPWDLKTGRVTTQPPRRRSRQGGSTAGSAPSVPAVPYTTRPNSSLSSQNMNTPACLAPSVPDSSPQKQVQQQHNGGGGPSISAAREPAHGNGQYTPPEPAIGDGCIDPRLLHGTLGTDGVVQATGILSVPAHYLPLMVPHLTGPPGYVDNHPLPGPSNVPEVVYPSLDDFLCEYLMFEEEDRQEDK